MIQKLPTVMIQRPSRTGRSFCSCLISPTQLAACPGDGPLLGVFWSISLVAPLLRQDKCFQRNHEAFGEVVHLGVSGRIDGSARLGD